MGESELVLDGMSVDEALRLIAGSGMGSGRAGSGRREAGSGDWREGLRATGAGPENPGVRTNTSERGDEIPQEAVPAPRGISVGAPAGEIFGGSMASLDTLEAIAKHVATCTRCPLYSTAKKP